ncbi:hypothetical protein LTS18_001176 [Coniosporium uncinatum]|uniref:Uncharacterized protein n=1 Tax=Coniosporium uncinatum TaxID=93489 RepID=A0ACC3DBT9_9PEZI|nr:hypothetical protein LTS18_001176 [Coniosporium uncinatum]
MSQDGIGVLSDESDSTTSKLPSRRGRPHFLKTETRVIDEDEKELQQICEAGNVRVIVYISRKNKPVNLCIAYAQPAGNHPNNHVCNEKVRKGLPERLAQFEGNTHVERLWAWLRRNPDRPNYAAHPSQVENVTPVALEPEETSKEVEDVTMPFIL